MSNAPEPSAWAARVHSIYIKEKADDVPEKKERKEASYSFK